LWFGILALTSCLAAVAQDRPGPEQLRTEARELMDKARDLKADGKLDESENAARKAKELVRQADNMRQKLRQQSGSSDEDRPTPRPPRDRIQSRPQNSDENRDVNRPDRPRRQEPRDGLEQRPLPPRSRDAWGGYGPRRPFLGGPGLRGGGGFNRFNGPPLDLAERRHHLKKAIKQLRLAGLYGEADRLEQRLREATRRFRASPDGQFRNSRPSPPRPERPDNREQSERP
jgi:hypothetical protein